MVKAIELQKPGVIQLFYKRGSGDDIRVWRSDWPSDSPEIINITQLSAIRMHFNAFGFSVTEVED